VLDDHQLDLLRFDAAGLIPAVVQQHDTGEVLMVAWMDGDALERTLTTGETVFYSRSRGELWHKGATSGNTQRVRDVRIDCDGDVLLVLVDQGAEGVACHTGERSCFHRRLPGGPQGATAAGPALAETADPRDPDAEVAEPVAEHLAEPDAEHDPQREGA
jgi:phosphoribosyl-AMP cyclohydrolase